jgi:pyruvate,water dikinase
VRSSAINEDGECSFAGQYTTILPVQKEGLMASYLAVLASKYTPEALSYRIHCGLTDEETPMAAMVVEMVDSITSGVIYTIEPAGQDLEHLFIHMVRGQGEALVSGRIIPQILAIDKKTMTLPLPDTQNWEITDSRAGFLTDEQAAELTSAALRIEAHFGRPQDIEWAINKEGEIFFLQTRMLQSQGPEAADQSPQIPKNRASLDTPEPPLIKGGAMAALGQGCGLTWCVDAEHPVEQVPVGAILVIRETLPSYVRVLDRVSGVLAELGSAAGHFSTVCREFGVPLLCGLGAMIKTIQHDQLITMDATNKMVYQGDLLPRLATIPLHESQKQLPFYRKLRKLLDHITPLRLVDPKARGFTPESCRSLHDIIRFVHEQAVKTMFSLGDRLSSRSNRSYSRKELHSNLPFAIFVVDVGGGLNSSAALEESITISQVCSAPFLALWTGLNHPSVQWQERAHFDWKHFGETTMGEGIVSASDPQFASYAVLGADYVNLNMRFGYHFTLVDTLCGRDINSNYCQFRFAGGGADFSGRLLRIDFISTLLKEAGFQVEARGDLLDARISGLAIPEMETRLLTLGRLLGATKLMDMALHNNQDVKQYVVDFIEATKQ